MAAGGEMGAGGAGRDLRDEHGLVLSVCKGRSRQSVGMPQGFAHSTIFTPQAGGSAPLVPQPPPSPTAAASAPAMVSGQALTAQHVVVGVVGDGVDVRGGLGAPLPLVGCHHGRGVDG